MIAPYLSWCKLPLVGVWLVSKCVRVTQDQKVVRKIGIIKTAISEDCILHCICTKNENSLVTDLENALKMDAYPITKSLSKRPQLLSINILSYTACRTVEHCLVPPSMLTALLNQFP